MSKFKILLIAAIVLVLVAVFVVTHNVNAGDPDGGGHGIIAALL